MADAARTNATAERVRAIAGIARQTLGITTLDERGSDLLDFHEVAVWSVQEALRLAWSGGYEEAVADRDAPDEAAARALAVCRALSDYAHHLHEDPADDLTAVIDDARAALAAADKA